jgi:hypothetical protein
MNKVNMQKPKIEYAIREYLKCVSDEVHKCLDKMGQHERSTAVNEHQVHLSDCDSKYGNQCTCGAESIAFGEVDFRCTKCNLTGTAKDILYHTCPNGTAVKCEQGAGGQLVGDGKSWIEQLDSKDSSENAEDLTTQQLRFDIERKDKEIEKLYYQIAELKKPVQKREISENDLPNLADCVSLAIKEWQNSSLEQRNSSISMFIAKRIKREIEQGNLNDSPSKI